MTKEETLLSKHLEDLAQNAWQRGIVTFSDFLNLNEQSIYHSLSNSLSFIHSELFGGYDFAERKMAAFIPDTFLMPGEDCSGLFPIRAVTIRPQNVRFAEDLSHRDYLGALMNLGIDRSCTGDIAPMDGCAILFCEEKMADYICENLVRVRHTGVICTSGDPADISYRPKTQEICGTVASVRLDTLMALAFRGSRSFLTSMISDGKVFVNGKLITTNAFHLKEGDIISVRGLGRFRFTEEGCVTRKGRQFVKLEKYI